MTIRKVINYQESAEFIRQGINDSRFKIKLDEITFDITDVTLNPINTNNILQEIIDKNKNFNENLELLKINLDDFNFDIFNLDDLSIKKSLENLLKIEKDTNNLLDDIAKIDNKEGLSFIKGCQYLVPPTQDDHIFIEKIDDNIEINGLTFSEIGWKHNDSFSLVVNNRAYLDNIFTKEINEYRKFNKTIKLSKNSPIKFIFHNNSGNYHQIWVDYEYTIIERNE
ncbi:hypothetical protein Bp8pS_131 [Bacillus phage vB_BpuM-BpSp]|nr:hypothetical protein Bp8pS_131 [Bacillus phage vB_BpuM-BpSp]